MVREVQMKLTQWACVVVGSAVVSTAVAQSPQADQKAATSPSKAATPAGPVRYHPDRFAGRAGQYYRLVWGVDSLSAKWAESGEVIRFSYRVLDPAKAKVLNDKAAEPSLEDPRAGVSLVIPQMEKIGKLRQTAAPEAGKSYWMTFSNKGRLVKRGDHVNVVIGKFRAEGLVVD
jgi:hypothetical protein